jgi:hypothetical protein
MTKQLLGMAVAGLLLAACSSSQQTSQPSAGMVPAAQTLARLVPMNKQGVCKSHNATISPCPIAPGRGESNGVTITVSGPGVVSASWVGGYCSWNGEGGICDESQISPTQFLVWWVYCEGHGYILNELQAFNASGGVVGDPEIKIKLCH